MHAWPFEVRAGIGPSPAQLAAPDRALPSRRRLRVFSHDPTLGKFEEPHYTVSVPFERLQAGPTGALLRVEDIDEDSGDVVDAGIDLDHGPLMMEHGLAPSSTSRQFMQQMVYAVGMETYERFVRALGRDPGFGPLPAHNHGRLSIRPCAFRQANAYYDRECGVLKFGYDVAREFAHGRSQPGEHVYTALSREIVVHEMSHALLDGLRPNFLRPTLPDVAALHEGFADLIAVFMRFSQPRQIERAIERRGGGVDDGLLVDIGRQFGFSLVNGRTPLRTAILTADDVPPGEEGQLYARMRGQCVDAGAGPHGLGSVLVTAVFHAFSMVYQERTRNLRRAVAPYQSGLSSQAIELLAREACRLARRFLNVLIRAIDYCPPLHCSFGEYLRALITADYELVRDDPLGYREAFVLAFRRFGITVPHVPDLSEESLRWQPPHSEALYIDALRFQELRLTLAHGLCEWPEDGVSAKRAAHALCATICTPRHGRAFGLMPPGEGIEPPKLISLRTLRRISPDQDVHFDLVGEVIQKRRVAEGWFLGGSTILIGPDGEVRYAVCKHIDSGERLEEQRAWLRTQGPDIAQAAWDRHSVAAARLQRHLHREPAQPESATAH